ncbi:hypothetical protein [Streptomyces sp. NPDC088739]|uniref:hypothetical protein n=1 Tax=Streptomyces sp. NPDC088739 TaxID=3365882 RepID=UPI0037F58AED
MKHFTRTAAGIFADTGQAVAALVFGAGTKLQATQRSEAIEALAPLFRVDTVRGIQIVKVTRPNGTSYDHPVRDPRRVDLVGAPADVARLLAAAPRILDQLEKLATRCSRRVGAWVRSADGQSWIEKAGVTSDGLAAARRTFRMRVFDHLVAFAVDPELAYCSRGGRMDIHASQAFAAQEFGADVIDPLSFVDEDEAAAVQAGIADPADVLDASEVVEEQGADSGAEGAPVLVVVPDTVGEVLAAVGGQDLAAAVGAPELAAESCTTHTNAV